MSLIPVVLAALSVFLLGGFWYSAKVFGGVWQQEEKKSQQSAQKHHEPWVFGVSFIFSLISALIFSSLLGAYVTLWHAIKLGAIIGVYFVATSFGINYVFAGRSWKLLLIDAGYHCLQFILYGLIIGLWFKCI